MPYFKILNPTQTYLLGNKDRKKYLLEPSTYKITKTKQNLAIITHEGTPILAISDKLRIPTLNMPHNSNVVSLDDGALKPILGGADVMAPGIFKYKSSLTYKEDEIVYIKIKDEIIAVGVAKIDYEKIDEESRGIAVELWLRKNDAVSIFKQ